MAKYGHEHTQIVFRAIKIVDKLKNAMQFIKAAVF